MGAISTISLWSDLSRLCTAILIQAHFGKHADKKLRGVGFTPIESWPSVYWHDRLKLLLSVYVDDFKLSGPKRNLKEGWDLIRAEIDLEPPAPANLYLGCEHEACTWDSKDGHPIKAYAYRENQYLRSAVSKYVELVRKETGKVPKLPVVPTPFLESSQRDSPQGQPLEGGPGT